mmetsp:Transcript_23880/g.52814  ORF Transcript_23880/g.52814 Transcript_23880/m.52814 type:complete len:504 (+) Transcript_23880:250-1761(+)|eukprot:CAMPEP_0201119866 /NCGR_PEP_ID=MMETSP0850-20130426/3973_1 /ASSEMBLY_ACC=CAM_ASM_000622 /TAXON_ID=183588 /ORGANISM="Pseudo-nitzschia fraudulenta, Strain WWA7" /LENGTH=503 /DNA_ID=CAMNT_0047385759 /DNA_START=122 /DNA_END=1633 /DNA_ORIENTATION=-
MMSLRNNNRNRTVKSSAPDSSSIKRNDYFHRLHITQQQQQQPQQQQEQHRYKQLEMDKSLSSTNSSKNVASASRSDISNDCRDEGDQQQPNRTEFDDLGPYDIVCGRGSAAFNNIGNRRFRILIGLNVDKYEAATGRHKKGEFIGSLVRTFRDDIGAKFYKMKQGKLTELSESLVRQKVGHALRDMLAFQERQQKDELQNGDTASSTESGEDAPCIAKTSKKFPRSKRKTAPALLKPASSSISSQTIHKTIRNTNNLIENTNCDPIRIPDRDQNNRGVLEIDAAAPPTPSPSPVYYKATVAHAQSLEAMSSIRSHFNPTIPNPGFDRIDEANSQKNNSQPSTNSHTPSVSPIFSGDTNPFQREVWNRGQVTTGLAAANGIREVTNHHPVPGFYPSAPDIITLQQAHPPIVTSLSINGQTFQEARFPYSARTAAPANRTNNNNVNGITATYGNANACTAAETNNCNVHDLHDDLGDPFEDIEFIPIPIFPNVKSEDEVMKTLGL